MMSHNDVTNSPSATATAESAALTRALALFKSPPAKPDTTQGYLDLLGGQASESPGFVQAVWASTVGSTFYDHGQALARKVFTNMRLPKSALRLPQGGRALDIGCGPGNLTAELGRAAGKDGLALGLDVSEPMLQRAVRAQASTNVGFLRADARQLPFRDATFDTVTSMAALQLVPEPFAVIEHMARVLAPGGNIAIFVPAPNGGVLDRVTQLAGNAAGIYTFDPEDFAETLQSSGVSKVHTRQRVGFLSVTGRKDD